eukprot:12882498-Prorocentrum_lima.AAC.1
MWIRAGGSSRRTYPYKVELLLGEEDQPDQDFIDLREETPLAGGAESVAPLQDVEDPAVLGNLAWDIKRKRAN